MSQSQDSSSADRIRPTRRTILEAALLGSAAAVAAPFAGAAQNAGAETAGPTPCAPQPFVPPPFELAELSFDELQEGLRSGRWSARSLVAAYLERIEALNHHGPELRAVIEANPDAEAVAAKRDAERREGRIRGPLHGIPILLKDNIDTADRMTTTAGSLALEGSIAPRDATIASRLRDAGAILLGKANMSEWANFRSDSSSSGWSSRGGQCRNPYVLDRSPSGSSSGSGCATAASLCAAAIGTETDGSIVSPANANSLVGIKPTLGLVSRTGIIPIAHSQDTAGPMARCVADAAALLNVLAGRDSRDSATINRKSLGGVDVTKYLRQDGTLEQSAVEGEDYLTYLDPHALVGKRIGVARKRYFGRHPAVGKLMESTLAALKDAGAILIDPADIKTAGEWGESEFEVLLYEFKADLNAYFASLGKAAPVKSLAEAIFFNAKERDRVMPYFGQETFEAAQKKGPLSEKKYRDALARNHRLTRKEGLDATFAKYKLDALVAPTAGPAWPIDLVSGDAGSGGCSSPCAVSGYPHITVPAGYVRGLPIGLSFMGLPWTEGRLIGMAYSFELATRARKPPRFLPSADLSGGAA